MYTTNLDDFDLFGFDEPDTLTDRLTDQQARLQHLMAGLMKSGADGWLELRIRLASHLQAERDVIYHCAMGIPDLGADLPVLLDGHRAIEARLRGDAADPRPAALCALVRAQWADEADTLLPLVRRNVDAFERRALSERFDARRRELVHLALCREKRRQLVALARANAVRGCSRMSRAVLARVLVD